MTVGGRLAALTPALLLTGCEGVLDPIGPVGTAERALMLDALGVMLVIVVPVIVATLAFAWWFRASNKRAEYAPTWAYSGQIEFVTWAIPALIVITLGGIGWIGSHRLDPYRPLESATAPIEIQVVAMDWKWLFIYPAQGIATVNTVTIPVGMPVRFRITSASVMNGFFVPRLGTMIYAMNGMATEVNLQADRPETIPGMSSHYSGDGFSDMRFTVRSVPAPQFEEWVAKARRAGPTLDPAAYVALTRQSQNVTPYSYRAIQPRLFDAIVTRRLPDGPGPATGRPQREISPRPEN